MTHGKKQRFYLYDYVDMPTHKKKHTQTHTITCKYRSIAIFSALQIFFNEFNKGKVLLTGTRIYTCI